MYTWGFRHRNFERVPVGIAQMLIGIGPVNSRELSNAWIMCTNSYDVRSELKGCPLFPPQAMRFPHTPVWGKIIPACEGYPTPAENLCCQAVPGEIGDSRETDHIFVILASK